MSLKRNPSRNVVNFSAGPSALPYEVLETAQKELIDFQNTGVSVMEISHRSSTFMKIITKAEQNVRELLDVPPNYKIMFLQGGGNGQFAAVAMNLMNLKPKRSADYFVTGYWSERAALEAQKYGNVNFVLPKVAKYTEIPDPSEWKLDPEASYVYICANETIDGVEFPDDFTLPHNIPLVADCSSNLFSKKIDVTKFGCIFAGAQKNFGPAGVTIVIIREDLIGHQIKECPTILDYKVQSANGSLYQTPPTFGIYVCGLVYEWLKNHGGMEKIGEVNKLKSMEIYETIDNSSGFYYSPVKREYRSRVTIPFRVMGQDGKPDEKLEKLFIEEGEKSHNLKELKGHRSVGGIRAAIFNAISLEEIQTLVFFMNDFRKKHTTAQ